MQQIIFTLPENKEKKDEWFQKMKERNGNKSKEGKHFGN